MMPSAAESDDAMDLDDAPLDVSLDVPQTPPVGLVWGQLERLQKQKLCFHCATRRWQHSLLPICTRCQPALQKLACRHCAEEFIQHRILIKAEAHFSRTICLACAKNVSEFGLPKNCSLCNHWASFGGRLHCDRCAQLLERYGTPASCVRCGNRAAFKRETEKMEKVDFQLLCFKCTTAFKKEKYRRSRRANDGGGARGAAPPRTEAPAADAARRDAEKYKQLVEQLKAQVTTVKQQLKRKEEEFVGLAKKFEQENFLLRRESEDLRRKASREELRLNQLVKELSDLDRARDVEVTKLIESNQEERERLNEMIERLKGSNEELEEALESKSKEIAELKSAAREQEQVTEHYKCVTERRVLRLSEKYSKIFAKHEERAKQRTKAIFNLRKQLAAVTLQNKQFLLAEKRALGLEDEEPLSHDAASSQESTSAGSSPGAAWREDPDAPRVRESDHKRSLVNEGCSLDEGACPKRLRVDAARDASSSSSKGGRESAITEEAPAAAPEIGAGDLAALLSGNAHETASICWGRRNDKSRAVWEDSGEGSEGRLDESKFGEDKLDESKLDESKLDESKLSERQLGESQFGESQLLDESGESKCGDSKYGEGRAVFDGKNKATWNEPPVYNGGDCFCANLETNTPRHDTSFVFDSSISFYGSSNTNLSGADGEVEGSWPPSTTACFS